MGKYDDIIDLPHHVSTRHPQMLQADRAAQFAPFAALTGHGDAIKETERLTQRRIELDETAKQRINEQLQLLQNSISEAPQIQITYFEPDRCKEGGSYITATGVISKIDHYSKNVILEEGVIIPIHQIYKMTGKIFNILDL